MKQLIKFYRLGLVIALTSLLANLALANTSPEEAETTKTKKVADTALFITPSLGFAHLKQSSSKAEYKLRSDFYLFNLDIELIDPSIAYHKINLSHSVADSSTQTYSGVSENFDLSQMHAAYNVGIKKLTSKGDFSFWTGLGWQATKVKDVALSATDKSTRLHFAYVPFGGEYAFHHAGKVYMLLGAEYRLIMDGWENYQYSTSGNPQQSNANAYAGWVGLDYLANPKRVLTFRLGYDYWEVKESAKDDLQGSEQKTFKLDIGVRF